MKLLFKLSVLLLILSSFLDAHTASKAHEKLPLSQSLPLLKSIQKYAINIGQGVTDVYLFVDPLCPRSKEFISLIASNKKMQRLYSYHIYLYELKRFHTQFIIQSIYSSDDPLDAMLYFMRDDAPLDTSKKLSTQAIKISRSVASVAEKLKVYKRPYLVLVKKGKK